MLKPDYKKYCITKTFEEIKKLFLKNNKVVLIVIDSLGYYNLIKISKHNTEIRKTLKKFKNKKITSVFPTTTVAAMSSIYSSQTPEEHSLYEWVMYSRELNMRFLPLMFKPTNDENLKKFRRTANKDLIKIKKVVSDFSSSGIKTYEILPKEILGSKFNSGFKNSIGYSNVVDAFIKLKKTIDKSKKKTLFYLYLPYYDTEEHNYGPYSEEAEGIVNAIFHLIDKELLEKLKIPMIITADHGCIDVKKEIRLNTKKWFWKKIWKNLEKHNGKRILPTGMARDLFLHVKANKIEFVIDTLRNKLDKYAYILKVKDLIEKGFFGLGQPSKKFLGNIGNVLVLPKGRYLVSFDNEHPFGGMHGGLSKEELYVPLLIRK